MSRKNGKFLLGRLVLRGEVSKGGKLSSSGGKALKELCVEKETIFNRGGGKVNRVCPGEEKALPKMEAVPSSVGEEPVYSRIKTRPPFLLKRNSHPKGGRKTRLCLQPNGGRNHY